MRKFFKPTIIIFALFIVVFVVYMITISKQNSSPTQSPFSISKITIYSSGYGINKNTNFQQPNWVLDLLQYSDIAIFIDNGDNFLDASNSVKSLILNDINVYTPKIGSGNLYYLNTLHFGTPNIAQNYKLTNSLEFTVINDSNDENWAKYSTPIFFADCSTPITLKYVNNPVKENFEIPASDKISFDGTLLRKANISLDDLATHISFTLNLKSNDNKQFESKVSLPIILKNKTNSIYDGNILIQNNYETWKFTEIAENAK